MVRWSLVWIGSVQVHVWHSNKVLQPHCVRFHWFLMVQLIRICETSVFLFSKIVLLDFLMYVVILASLLVSDPHFMQSCVSTSCGILAFHLRPIVPASDCIHHVCSQLPGPVCLSPLSQVFLFSLWCGWFSWFLQFYFTLTLFYHLWIILLPYSLLIFTKLPREENIGVLHLWVLDLHSSFLLLTMTFSVV